MASIKFMQLEKHHVSVRKGMIASTEDWDGNEVISKDEREYNQWWWNKTYNIWDESGVMISFTKMM